MRIFRYFGWTVLLCLLLLLKPMAVSAAGKQTIYNSPYVSFSPDGKAWTTNAGDTAGIWYASGFTVETGIRSTLREPETGEHLYTYTRQGTVPVGSWIVKHRTACCIHSSKNSSNSTQKYYHGLNYRTTSCLRSYYSGWMATCADCGNILVNLLMYMSESAADSIDYLEMREDLDYYYLCPLCRCLEQGAAMGCHQCKAVSWNRYKVVYHPNTTEKYGGFMASTWHMYNNATEYEGVKVTPVKHLTLNGYSRVGYEFVEWNTKPDGTGDAYADGAEIWNLTAEEGGAVTLYAQWRISQSTLRIDPAGGSYQGSTETVVIQADHGSSLTLDGDAVTAPAGYTVSFAVNGGADITPVIGTLHFAEWCMAQPFLGTLRGNVYRFTAPDGNVDTVTAGYETDPITLPEPRREGYSFGGWYYDSSFYRAAGWAGDTLVPLQDMTLYAQWVDLTLVSVDNYGANDGMGAVDLSWSQSDGNNKIYLAYQSLDGKNWIRINDAGDISNSNKVDISFGSVDVARQFTVPYTGRYTLTAQGAQGGSYETYRGGYGGSVTADIWLMKGEILTFTVGGRNGYNGGGAATNYGNGGGCTTISSDQKGVLLVAGGGGGASASGNGGSGGSNVGVVKEDIGQSGMAGGGGGYQGGAAGESIMHSHNKQSSCYHSHIGSSETGGGCYGSKGTKQTMRVCEPEVIYWGTDTWEHALGCGGIVSHSHYAFKGTNGCKEDHGWVFIITCSVCGELPGQGRVAGKHTFWYKTEEYTLSCGLEETYYCGYTDGQIIGSKPAYGGSSYVNAAYAVNYEMQAGVGVGDGKAFIRSQTVGFMEELEIGGVAAPDMAPPERVSQEVKIEALNNKKVKIRWKEPADNGTEYLHMVESYLQQTEKPLCRSNITRNTLVSGVKGYYYLSDDAPATKVTVSNGLYTEQNFGFLEFDGEEPEQVKYLHVAAMDAAGNLSETTHIRVDSGNGDVEWPLYTSPLELERGDNVYDSQDGIWYVRSDGRTPFTLHYLAYLDGRASVSYQPNYVIFETSVNRETARNLIYTPSHPVGSGEIRTEAEGLTYSQQGPSTLELYPYSVTIRSKENRELRAVQKFLPGPELSGTRMEIIPVAGADRGEKIVYSDYQKDKENGIVVIADGEAPVISGMELMESMELIDRGNISLTLTVYAMDELSGLREFYVAIVNTDNVIEKIYRPEDDGRIRIEITGDEPIFSGDFAVTAHAVDNVGNVAEVVYGTTEFALAARVERILEPHDPIFKNGESGILTFTVWGYADRVEVEFPEEMTAADPGLNRTFVYTDTPMYLQEERLQFMIPLYAPGNRTYTITIRAYKGDRKLEEHPAVGVVQVEGTVLDEFRTRLR